MKMNHDHFADPSATQPASGGILGWLGFGRQQASEADNGTAEDAAPLTPQQRTRKLRARLLDGTLGGGGRRGSSRGSSR